MPARAAAAARMATCLLWQTHRRVRQPRSEPRQMSNVDFYSERKWCNQCKTYVRYLMSVEHSYCVHCGTRVQLFSSDDARRFIETVQRHKWQAS
jgi:hypothetical protein